MRLERPGKGHKPNHAKRRGREKYRLRGRLRANKLRRLGRMLVTASEPYATYLCSRVQYWSAR